MVPDHHESDVSYTISIKWISYFFFIKLYTIFCRLLVRCKLNVQTAELIVIYYIAVESNIYETKNVTIVIKVKSLLSELFLIIFCKSSGNWKKCLLRLDLLFITWKNKGSRKYSFLFCFGFPAVYCLLKAVKWNDFSTCMNLIKYIKYTIAYWNKIGKRNDSISHMLFIKYIKYKITPIIFSIINKILEFL